jgi:hypothetical protein
MGAVTVAANTAVILKGLLDTPLVDVETGRPRQAARRHVHHERTSATALLQDRRQRRQPIGLPVAIPIAGVLQDVPLWASLRRPIS